MQKTMVFGLKSIIKRTNIGDGLCVHSNGVTGLIWIG